MYPFLGMGTILSLVIICFAVGSFLALPWIWYHAGFISRKLDRTNELLESIKEALREKGTGEEK